MSAKRDIARHLPLKPVEFILLAVLQDGPLHGYGLVREIDERTKKLIRVRPGDLYRVLYRLEARDLVETRARKEPEGSAERRTFYGLTKLGRRVLRAEADLLASIIAQVEGAT